MLIPKGHSDLCVIGRVKVSWKMVTGIINCRLALTIAFHDTLYGLHASWGIGTTSLESKMLQQLTKMREDILHNISLGLKKAYGILDQERCLDILAGYNMGPRAL